MPIAHKISTLWIVVILNMIFADILSLYYPGFLTEFTTTGMAEGITITPGMLLVAAVFIEIAIVMIYFSRALRRRTSRIANLIAVVITILFVVGGGSLKLHYIVFASVEVIALLYIAYLAWTWPEDEIA